MCIENDFCRKNQIVNVSSNDNEISSNIINASNNINNNYPYLTKGAIVDIYNDEEYRKFINRNIFILNNKVYQYFFNSTGKKEQNSNNDINKYGDEDTKKYIISKIDEEENLDKYIKNCSSYPIFFL